MFDFNNIFSGNSLIFTIKVLLAALAFVFFMFTVIIISRVKTLNRSVQIYAHRASSLLYLFSIIYSISVFFLFVIILVIV